MAASSFDSADVRVHLQPVIFGAAGRFPVFPATALVGLPSDLPLALGRVVQGEVAGAGPDGPAAVWPVELVENDGCDVAPDPDHEGGPAKDERHRRRGVKQDAGQAAHGVDCTRA